MFVSLITDCQDANALARIQVRTDAQIPGCSFTEPIGVTNDIEAAGNLVDLLDASGGAEGIIMVNVAPRNGAAQQWENGSPFGYFSYDKTLVIATIDGVTLSLAKQLGAMTSLVHVDIPAILTEMTLHAIIPPRTGARIASTQFRSFEFVPRLAKWIRTSQDFPRETVALDTIPDPPKDTVWWVDHFGNCKLTTIPPRGLKPGTSIGIRIAALQRNLPFFARLRDVPTGQAAFVQGSSGIDRYRFLELVVNGGNAAKQLGIASGDELILEFPERVESAASTSHE